jgi:hypothetical protein
VFERTCGIGASDPAAALEGTEVTEIDAEGADNGEALEEAQDAINGGLLKAHTE